MPLTHPLGNSTGRKCDGYPTETCSWRQSPESKQPVAVMPKANLFRTEHEMRSYQFFHERTLSQITSLAHNDFWSRLVLQAAHTEPTIRHAIVALSEFHRRFLLLPGEGASNEPHFALWHYNRAINKVLRAVDSHDSLYLRLICCVVFVSIEVSDLILIRDQAN